MDRRRDGRNNIEREDSPLEYERETRERRKREAIYFSPWKREKDWWTDEGMGEIILNVEIASGSKRGGDKGKGGVIRKATAWKIQRKVEMGGRRWEGEMVVCVAGWEGQENGR